MLGPLVDIQMGVAGSSLEMTYPRHSMGLAYLHTLTPFHDPPSDRYICGVPDRVGRGLHRRRSTVRHAPSQRGPSVVSGRPRTPCPGTHLTLKVRGPRW